MTGRTAAAAVNRLLSNLQLAVSTVTRAVPIPAIGSYRPGPNPHSLPLDCPLRVNGGERLNLSVRYHFTLERQSEASKLWLAETSAYFYELVDAEGREILAYHWHRFGSGPVTYPHLHLGPGSEAGRVQLLKAHLPTGPILLQDVLRLAIVDFGVRPLRRDWAAILDSTAEELNSGA